MDVRGGHVAWERTIGEIHARIFGIIQLLNLEQHNGMPALADDEQQWRRPGGTDETKEECDDTVACLAAAHAFLPLIT